MAQPKDDSATQNKTPFFTADTAYDAYDESRKWYRIYFEPLDEFERIARNKPSPRIDPSLPRITGGEMASIVQELPKRVIQQLATGKISSPDYPEYAAIADIVHAQRLLPLYNRMGNALQKHWNMLGKSMTYGVSTSYTFFTSTEGRLHTDFVIPYIKDVYGEKGKVFLPDSNIRFMRSWYQARDIKAIIAKEKALMAANKDYTSDWDLKGLADFLEAGASSKNAEQMTPAEKEKGGDTGGFEVIHAFQKGKGAEFYSFAPMFNGGKALRTKVTKDPRGMIPLDDLYCNIDLSNPLGRGQVELSGGIQNLMDQQLQMYQFMNTMEQGPPLQVWGNVNKASLKFRPGAIWDMGSNPNNKVEPYAVNNAFMSNFTANAQFLQSKIYNLNNTSDSSIPAASNTVNQSKTDAGVKQSQERLGTSDKYLRNQFESWFESQAETSVNTFFAEMTSTESIEIGKQQIQELQSTRAAKYIKGEKLTVNYKEISDCSFTFEVDPSSSKSTDDQQQLLILQELVKEIESNPLVVNYYLAQAGRKINMGEIYIQRMKRMGLQNIDTILSEMSPEEAQQAKQAPFPIIDKPQIRINTADLTAEQIVAALHAGGVSVPPQPGMPPQPGQPPAGLSPQGLADFMVEMTKAQAAVQAAGAPQAPQGPTPDELALKHRELDIKQQNADNTDTKTALDIHNTAHAQTMDMHNAVQTAMTPDPAQAEQVQAPQPAPAPAPQNGQYPAASDPHTPEEQKIVEALLQRGYSEQDVEQALVMLRNRVPVDQIMRALGSKHAT